MAVAVAALTTMAGAGAASSDPSRATTLVDAPLFAVTEPDPRVDGPVSLINTAMAAITCHVESGGDDDGTGIPRRPGVCAAFLHQHSVTLAAGHGAVFRARGDAADVVLDARTGPRGASVPAQAGDVFALCNPALLAAVPAARICWVLQSPGPATLLARRLLAFANQSGDADEAAVVVLRIGDHAD